MNMEQQDQKRYSIESPKPGFYNVYDSRSGVAVTFEERRFQETQHWTVPAGKEFNRVALSRLCDHMEAWIRLQHPDIFAEPGKFTLTRSGDGHTITITRPDQGLTISFPSSTGKITAAAQIRAVSMWLKSMADNWDNVNF